MFNPFKMFRRNRRRQDRELYKFSEPINSSVRVLAIELRFDNQEPPIPVGTLANAGDRIRFEYDPEFLNRELNLSPVMLERQPRPGPCPISPFHGIHGVFADSLPDRWGDDLLVDAIDPAALDPVLPRADNIPAIDRLAIAADDTMGALRYRILEGEPPPAEWAAPADDAAIMDADELDRLALNAWHIEGKASYCGAPPMTDRSRELIRLAGNAGGAVPKMLAGVDENGRVAAHARRLPPGFQPWLLKFHGPGGNAYGMGRGPDVDDGAIEQAYARTARAAGLNMPPTRLLPSNTGPGHFAIQRFDRAADGGFLHMHTAAGLLHQRIGLGVMAYEELLDLNRLLVANEDDRRADAQEIYRLAVFNVLACNRDDHGKNFSFLMDRNRQWRLAPAYDLFFRTGMADSQATTINGVGYHPGEADLLKLAETADIPPDEARRTIDQVRAAIADLPATARDVGVSDKNIEKIAAEIEKIDRRFRNADDEGDNPHDKARSEWYSKMAQDRRRDIPRPPPAKTDRRSKR